MTSPYRSYNLPLGLTQIIHDDLHFKTSKSILPTVVRARYKYKPKILSQHGQIIVTYAEQEMTQTLTKCSASVLQHNLL